MSKKEKRLSKKLVEPVAEEPRVDLWAWARRILAHPATSYIAILLLQLKVIWGIWWFKDMTTGDTVHYYLDGVSWFHEGIASFVWSPLYTTFIGELFHFSSDAYTILILHRVLIVMALAVILLTLMRRLLPPFTAWLAAASWVVLPIDFNALYEVHLFAVIPLALAPLAILWRPGPWGRGIGVAMLTIAGLLMRNENLAAAMLVGVLALGYDLWRIRKAPDPGAGVKTAALAYGVPMLGAVLFAAFFFVHRQTYDSWEFVRAKHNLNVCESFAAGYKQREKDFEKNPMNDCGQLMQRVFGASLMRQSISRDTTSAISMTDALRANPSAMFAHFWWNIRLLPEGLQVLLFNFRSGPENPDFAATDHSDLALIPSTITCAILALGGYFFFSRRREWLRTWKDQNTPLEGSVLEGQIWAWITLVSLSIVVAGVILTNRPRASYMFILGIAIRALVGLCFYVILLRWPKLGPITAALAVPAICAAFALPSVYEYFPSPRPLLKAYQRLKPYQRFFHEAHPLLVSREFGTELAGYAGECHCATRRFDELRALVTPEKNFAQVLAETGATVFLVDEPVLADPLAREFLANAREFHWDVMEEHHVGDENWAVLHRSVP